MARPKRGADAVGDLSTRASIIKSGVGPTIGVQIDS